MKEETVLAKVSTMDLSDRKLIADLSTRKVFLALPEEDVRRAIGTAGYIEDVKVIIDKSRFSAHCGKRGDMIFLVLKDYDMYLKRFDVVNEIKAIFTTRVRGG